MVFDFNRKSVKSKWCLISIESQLNLDGVFEVGDKCKGASSTIHSPIALNFPTSHFVQNNRTQKHPKKSQPKDTKKHPKRRDKSKGQALLFILPQPNVSLKSKKKPQKHKRLNKKHTKKTHPKNTKKQEKRDKCKGRSSTIHSQTALNLSPFHFEAKKSHTKIQKNTKKKRDKDNQRITHKNIHKKYTKTPTKKTRDKR